MNRNPRIFVIVFVLVVLLFSMACSFGNMIPSFGGGGTASATPETAVQLPSNTKEAPKPATPTSGVINSP